MALSIAKFIKMKRKEAGLTQEEFADKAGVADRKSTRLNSSH